MSDNKDLVIFSKYFGYNVGGAEKSTFRYLLNAEVQGANIRVVRIENVTGFNAQSLKMDLPSQWQIDSLYIPKDFSRFKYLGYFLNRRTIIDYFRNQRPEGCLVTYGIMAPAALISHPGKSIYVIRDELGLGHDLNYYTGTKKILKSIYRAVEYPWFHGWFQELKAGVRNADRMITSSHFMADLARNVLNTKTRIDVEYPDIDEVNLKTSWHNAQSLYDPADYNIVTVGFSPMKGKDILLKLAAMFPEKKFHIFDRFFRDQQVRDNLIFHPWNSSVAQLLKGAHLLLAPSICYEAFSRIVREARILNVPVLASDRGGIPEAADVPQSQSPHLLIRDISNIDAWQSALTQLAGTVNSDSV